MYCRSILLSFEQNGERGIRTLAPLLTTYSLSRGAPSASLGISPKRPSSNIHDSFLFVQYFFLIFQNGHLALEYSIFCFRKSPSFFLSGSKKNILFSVYNTFRKFLHDFTENKKECASAHSRAERGRLRHSSSSCECASPARSAFYFIGSSFGISYEIKKAEHFVLP